MALSLRERLLDEANGQFARRWRLAGAAALCAAVTAGALVVVAGARATSYNWGSPPNVCDQVSNSWYNFAPDNLEGYETGMCSPAVSPSQTVKGTSALQYLVPCSDAGAGTGQFATGAGTYPYSLGFLQYSFSESYSKVVAWTTGSSVVSGEVVTSGATANSTPVKVYNGEVAWDSTQVTFAAGCLNETGLNAWEGTAPAGYSRRPGSALSARATRRPSFSGMVRRLLADFASGRRKRAEYAGATPVSGGVAQAFGRVNLKSFRGRDLALACPAGTRPAGEPQLSYGFDSLADLSTYRPRIRASRTASAAGVTYRLKPGKLRYPTSAYAITSCAGSGS